MGRHSADRADTDVLIHVLTDTDAHANLQPVIPHLPVRFRLMDSGRRYHPKPDREFESAMNAMNAVADPTDDELDVAMEERVKGHRSKVLPGTAREVSPGWLSLVFVLMGAGSVLTLMFQFMVELAGAVL